MFLSYRQTKFKVGNKTEHAAQSYAAGKQFLDCNIENNYWGQLSQRRHGKKGAKVVPIELLRPKGQQLKRFMLVQEMFLGYGLNAPHLCSMQRDKFLMMNHTNEAYLGDKK